MPITIPLDLPRLTIWMIRLIANESVLSRMYMDPLLFATWYASGESMITWPDEAVKLQENQRSKKLSLERSLALLDRLGKSNFSTNASVKEARALLEGYAMHEWVTCNWRNFKSLVQTAASKFDTDVEQSFTRIPSEFSTRVSEFSRVLKLNLIEQKVLSLAFTCAIFAEFRDLLNQLVKERRSNIIDIWCAMLDCKESELKQAFSASGVLRTSRLLKTYSKDNQIPNISDFWIYLLTNPLESVFDSLLKPLVLVPGAGIPARLSDEDQLMAVDILKNSTLSKKPEIGINLLMYGADAFEKRGLLDVVLVSAEKKGFVLKEFENAHGELPCITYVAQRLLFDKHGLDAVLVIEKPGDVLERKPSEFIRTMFGIELDSAHIAPLDQLLLETNPAPTIWAGPGSDNLLEECIARFVFHAPLKKARREDRRAQLEVYVDDLKLGKTTKLELLTLEDVSSKQLETALRASRLSGAKNKKEREEALVRAVRRSLSALKRDTSPKAKECVTEYSLEYLNYAGKFGPEQIMKALKLRPKGSLCLYGPPGTGKTQFVEHLAQQLGIRLIIKRASDLLSKWVGDNEKNIAAMFQEAELEEALLFLDEGDSFLRDRSLATQSWEVTKVNELLQGMERFNGIFIVATNLFKGLDTAALRRFTFKMELRALSPDQRWGMFISESEIKSHLGDYTKSQKDGWRGELYLMHQLAAGDFATVKRQCILLDEVLTPDQWIEQLQIECNAKLDSQSKDEPESPPPPAGVKKPPKMVH